MDQPELNVHDIAVNETTYFTQSGAVAKQTKVTYYIGTHGPFTLAYAPADATADRIKQDIRDQVKKLQDIHELIF